MGKKRRSKPRNPDKRRAWRTMFSVEGIEERAYVKFAGIKIPTKHNVAFYVVRDIRTGEILGKYNDYVYACKQAWYKYKKRLRKIEKILLDQ